MIQATEIFNRFLLAKLHLDFLKDKTTPRSVKRAVEGLPKGGGALEKAYDEAIERIENQRPGFCELAKRAILWITYAERQLTVRELQHALAIEIGERNFDPDNVDQVEDILSVCAGLLTLDKETSIVRFVHYTTQEYFEKIRESWLPGAESAITNSCLSYLSYDIFFTADEGGRYGFELSDNKVKSANGEKEVDDDQNDVHGNGEDDNDDDDEGEDKDVVELATNISESEKKFYIEKKRQTKKARRAYPLLYYAVAYWGVHASRAKYEEWESLAVQFLGRIGDEHHFPYFVECLQDRYIELRRTGVHIAAWFGLERLVLSLVEQGCPPNELDSNGWTPLTNAAQRGQLGVVKLLVDREDVDADSRDTFGQSPLSVAATAGQDAVVRLLVERDDVEVTERLRELYAAV